MISLLRVSSVLIFILVEFFRTRSSAGWAPPEDKINDRDQWSSLEMQSDTQQRHKKRELDVTRTNNLAEREQDRERDEIGGGKNETLKIHEAPLERGFLVEFQ